MNHLSGNSIEELYRTQYFQVIDTAISSLDQYFTSTDIEEYKSYCDIILEGSKPPKDFFSKHIEFSESLVSEVDF